jgi:methyl-accepting chemotaxis protein
VTPTLSIITGASTMVRRSARRRWWLVVGGATALLFFGLATPEGVPWGELSQYLGLGGAATLGLQSLAGRGVKGPAAVLVGAIVDLLLSVAPVALLGTPGLGLLPLFAMAPYAESDEGLFGLIATVIAGVGLLAARAITDDAPGVPGIFAAEAALVIIVGIGLRAVGHRRARRIEGLRLAALQAAEGDFSTRFESRELDSLGDVERGFDLLAIRTADALGTLGREATEVASVAGRLATMVERLEQAAGQLSGAAGGLASDLQQQRTLAEDSRRQTEGAASDAGQQRERAQLLADDASRLVIVADRARQSVARASETLVAVGADVSTTATLVNDLTAMSARIGSFTQTIATIARQTHLLSLNAAIEAARAEEEGQGFGVVAEEVRALAAQAGRSAREVSELVTELQDGIAGAARAMNAGRQQVEDVARVSKDADEHLRELAEGVRRSSERLGTLAGGSKAQADHLQSLRGALEQVSRTSQGAAASSDGAAKAATQQSQTVQELARAAQQLTGLAERLKAAVKR